MHIVVVETLGLLVVGLFGDVEVGVTVVVCTRSVVNGETVSLVGLPVGQSVVGSNVGQDVEVSVDTVVHGGQDAQVSWVVGVVIGVVHDGVVLVSLGVVDDVGQVGGGHVANVDVIVVVVTTACGSSTARATVSDRLSSSVCIA
jgi:hypothetical protein